MPNTVFIVEDDDHIAIALDFLLRREGHVPRRVSSGGGALDCIRTDLPDLVLLDLMLHGRQGDEICRTLRSDPALESMKVVLMSTSPGVEARSAECGADAFVVKPFANDAINDTLQRVFLSKATAS